MSQQQYFGQSAYPGPYAQARTAPRDPGVDQPWYGIGFGAAIARVFQKYATFSGRASRGEYWWFFLFNNIISAGVWILILVGGTTRIYSSYSHSYVSIRNGFGTALYILDIIYALACFVPMLAVAVRRLHDTNKSGAWYCVIFIPFAGPVWLIILLATETYPGATQWDVPSGNLPSGYPNPGYGPMGYPPPGFSPQAPPSGYPPYAQGFTPQGYPPQAPNPPYNYPPNQGYPPPEGWR